MIETDTEEKYMVDFIKDICDIIGPRLAFTDKEKEGAKFVENEFKKFCNKVHVEKFSARTGLFLIDFRIAAISYIISSISFMFFPWISLILMIFVITTLLLVNIWNIRFFDFFGKVKESQNVIGTISPKNKSKKIVIFGSHIDSAYELTLIRKFQQKFMIIIAIGLLFMFIMMFFSIFKLIMGNFEFYINGFENDKFDVFSVILIIGNAGVFPLYFMVNYNLVVEGANDNLSAIAVCMNLMKRFSQNPSECVELRFIAFGAEEGGRIGSSKYAENHKKELKNSYTINFETLGGKGKLVIIKKEVTVPHSMEVVKLLSEAAEKSGHPMDLYSVPIAGGTDSWQFSRRGLKAAAITNLSEKTIPEGWHCREDTPKIIDATKLKIVSDACVEFIKLVEKKQISG